MSANQWMQFTVAAFVLVLLIALVMAGLSTRIQTRRQHAADWLRAISAALIGAVVAALLLTLALNISAQRKNEADVAALKSQLIVQLGSIDAGRTGEAARLLENYGWLRDGSLRGSVFRGANLQGILLSNADLRGANFHQANLEGAVLIVSDLQNAEFSLANLKKARLYNANLVGAQLGGAIFDEGTQLPDLSYWTPGTDLARFTNPAHPNFWHPSEAFGAPWWASNLAESIRQGMTAVPTAQPIATLGR